MLVQFFPQKIERINRPSRHVIPQNEVDPKVFVIWIAVTSSRRQCWNGNATDPHYDAVKLELCACCKHALCSVPSHCVYQHRIIRLPGTSFSELWVKVGNFAITKTRFYVWSTKWQHFRIPVASKHTSIIFKPVRVPDLLWEYNCFRRRCIDKTGMVIEIKQPHIHLIWMITKRRIYTLQ